ncbi:unnamed protein product [Microthlaspi erraticum]|uniref:Uncharacterized protein n=1 Tax=Microthlaspi erraticum TaxID=1685480 RepID=A0A6D2JDH9_9BRAS|nr:unnamed protein product [Microthlaspi erraticum]
MLIASSNGIRTCISLNLKTSDIEKYDVKLLISHGADLDLKPHTNDGVKWEDSFGSKDLADPLKNDSKLDGLKTSDFEKFDADDSELSPGRSNYLDVSDKMQINRKLLHNTVC